MTYMSRLRVVLVLLFHLSLIGLTTAAPSDPKPQPKPKPGDDSGKKLPMGIGITADGLKGLNPFRKDLPPDNQSHYKKIVTEYFSVITPGNEMKWGTIEPNQGAYQLDGADEIMKYAQDNNKDIHIHTLFAHDQNPPWVNGMQAWELEQKMVAVLQQVISKYGKKATGMDVCNEVINESGQLDNGPWKNAIGDGWLQGAYQHAKIFRDQYAPNMLLFINDYNIESINQKSTGLLAIAKDLHDKKLLDAVGFQCHLVAGQFPDKFKENLERFTAVGLKVALTEVDVRINLNGQQKPSQQDIDKKTQDYKKVYETCRQVRGCISVTTWGVTPDDSWIGHVQFQGYGAATLFENDFSQTPAMKKLIEAGFFPKVGS
ncbi:hypothetical protein PGT21_022456 [Puccinia graminis f. sp. tritici]|uniref:Beta-xylanase n=1 Tax=Puccinia graminis f. sp. tritici TaxID=56615 RepID=A0A5B0MPB8_PUCGR|nr:hypothetical protein PGT21_022456 [Puccinia graminis f. sp. tritici]KAA1102574.1 hypothetical protein PGTUg99_018524 [Puccinia graminis f. sp. tritici]